MAKKPKAPLLDNIETSVPQFLSANSLHINGLDDFSSSSLYSDDASFWALFDLQKCKKIAVDTAVALIDFGNDFDWKDRGRAMYDCGNYVAFNGDRIVSANFCRQRLCPLCQRRKSLRTYSDFCRILDILGDYRFCHLVLTVPNVKSDELSETLDMMNKCSSRFFKIDEVSRAFCGVARVLEISYNRKNNSFHPHFHCLVAVKKSYFTSRYYLKFDRLRFLWSAVWTFRYDNLNKVPDKKILESNLLDINLLQIHITKADSGALPEIAKYAVKPLSFDASRKERAQVLQALFEAIHGRRMIQTYGVIRDASKKAKISFDECFDIDTNNDVDNSSVVVYNYNHRLSQYEKVM